MPGTPRSCNRSLRTADPERQALAQGRSRAAHALVRRRLWVAGRRGARRGRSGDRLRYLGFSRNWRGPPDDNRSDGRTRMARRALSFPRRAFSRKAGICREERGLSRRPVALVLRRYRGFYPRPEMLLTLPLRKV